MFIIDCTGWTTNPMKVALYRETGNSMSEMLNMLTYADFNRQRNLWVKESWFYRLRNWQCILPDLFFLPTKGQVRIVCLQVRIASRMQVCSGKEQLFDVLCSLPKGTSTLRPLGDAMGTPPAWPVTWSMIKNTQCTWHWQVDAYDAS